jgi:hypothetical protein
MRSPGPWFCGQSNGENVGREHPSHDARYLKACTRSVRHRTRMLCDGVRTTPRPLRYALDQRQISRSIFERHTDETPALPVSCPCRALTGWSAETHAGKRTVCTITVNSSDEKEMFKQRLPRASTSSWSWSSAGVPTGWNRLQAGRALRHAHHLGPLRRGQQRKQRVLFGSGRGERIPAGRGNGARVVQRIVSRACSRS